MSQLSEKIAVVTGASKGIRASIAEHLAAAGATDDASWVTGQTLILAGGARH